MKVKKFPQSHLVITNDFGNKLIIDPGVLTFSRGFKITNFQGADAYLITHRHPDHLGPETIKQIVKQSKIYGNYDVVSKLKEIGLEAVEVKNNQNFKVANFQITAINLPHFEKPGVKMPPNTGFLIDGIFFHPGDGWKIDNLKSEKAAIPISGPEDGDIGPSQGLTLAKNLKAKLIIPIHYDSHPIEMTEFIKLANSQNINIKILHDEEELNF